MVSIPMGAIPRHHVQVRGGDTVAVRHGNDALTWGELEARSTRRAWALKAKGVAQDDLVTLALPNNNAFFEWTFAIWKLGATPHVISWRLPSIELDAVLELARP